MSNNEIHKIPDPQEIDKTLGKRFEKYDKKDVIEALFSNNVMIVEGDSEYGAFPIFSTQSKLGFENTGTKLIRADGKGNIKYYANFFSKCQKEVICLFDNDKDIAQTLKDYDYSNVKIIKQKKDYD